MNAEQTVGSTSKPPIIEPFADLAARTGLTKRLTNDGGAVDSKRLEGLREPAVAAVKRHMAQLRKERAEALRPRLIAQRDASEVFRDRRLEQLQRREQAVLESGRKLRIDEAQRLARARHELLALVEARNRWLLQRMETDERAYVRIAAVLVGA